MLLTLYNLPANTRYGDIKGLLQSKCGLQNLILDNLVLDGSSKKVTVGVSEDADAAILVRKINGLYWNGNQLYVEDVRRQKAKAEQPYRSSNPQPLLNQGKEFPELNIQQNSSYNQGAAAVPGVQPMMAMYYVPGYNQEYSQPIHNDPMQNATAYMGMGGYLQNSMQMSQLGMTPQLQYPNQQDNNQTSVGNNWKNSYEPPEKQNFGNSSGFNQGFRRQDSPQRELPWTQESDGVARNDFDTRPLLERSYLTPWNEPKEPLLEDDHLERRPERQSERFSNRSIDRSVEFSRQPDWQGQNKFLERMDRPDNGFSAERPVKNNFSERPGAHQERPNERLGSTQFGITNEFPKRLYEGQGRPNEFSGRPNEHQGRPNEFSGRPNERQGRPNDFSGRPNERLGRSNEFSGRPNERQGRPNEFSGRPNERQGRPNDFSGRTNERLGRPNEFSGRPDERLGRPNEFSGRPNERQGRPDDFPGQPNEFSGRSNERQGRPNGFSGLPNELQGRPNEFSGRSNERQGRPNGFSGRSNERQGRPNEFSGRPNERQGRPNEFSGRPNDRQGRPNENLGRLYGSKGRPSEFSERPNERQGRPTEFSGRPHDRPGKPNEFSGRQYERKDRPSEFSRRPNKRPNTSNEPPRPVDSKRPNLGRSADRPAFAQTEITNPKPPGPPKKRKIQKPDDVATKVSRDILGQRQDSIPLTIQPDTDLQNEELSEAAKEKLSKQLRKNGAKKVCNEIYASQGIEFPNLITRQTMNKFVLSRMDELLGDQLMVSPLECFDIYRNRYPSTEDAAAFAQVSAIVASTLKNEEPATNKADPQNPPGVPKPAKLTKLEKLRLQRIEEAKVRIAQGGIPTFPMEEKRKIPKEKLYEKPGYIPEVAAPLKKAIGEELNKIVKLFTDELSNAPSAELQRVYDTVDRDDLCDELVQNLHQQIAKRLTNDGLKLIRVVSSPRMPKRREVVRFLLQYGVVSLRRIQRKKWYTAAIDTYEMYDKLLAMASAPLGDEYVLSFEPLRPVPKQRTDQRQLRAMINNMIDSSDLNLLDKDWPSKEIKIKANLEAKNAKKQVHDDEKRALEDKPAPELKNNKTTGDNQTGGMKPQLMVDKDGETQTADWSNFELTDDMNETEDYMEGDFEVIDEVNEWDDDTEQVEYSIDNVDVDINDDDCLEDY